jgi:hypothetical protein
LEKKLMAPFVSVWYNLRPFVNVMAIWNILRSFVVFFRIWYDAPRKIWQP